MATKHAGMAQFELDLLGEWVQSDLAAARAHGKTLGRQPGQRPKPDKLLTVVLQSVGDSRSYRWIARDLGINIITVSEIMKRHREKPL